MLWSTKGLRSRGLAAAALSILSSLSILPLVGVSAAAASDDAGARLYREQCASCHGADGEGVKDRYARPLTGEWSLRKLTRYIDRWMPEEDPKTCSGEQAEAVARHVFDAFYSEEAQARRGGPRVELTRLTIRQHRHAITDLVAELRGRGAEGRERGLHAAYFNARQPRGRAVLERTDPEVRFDFGRSGPFPEKVEAKGFSARWRGSVLAPDTGRYEIVVRCDRAFRLWVNDERAPAIDAWVQSGEETEFRVAVFFLDGRAYPIRLEFTSRDQGVNKEGDGKPVPARVELAWRRPHGVDEVIPARYLRTGRPPEVLVVDTPFPPDDRSAGYERGVSASRAWDEATTGAAIAAARYIADHVHEIPGGRKGAPDRDAKLRDFCAQLVERAFRRPLTDDQRALYVDRQFAAASDPETAVKRVVLLALKSPRFLYVDPGGETPDAWTVAARLSLAIWDSLPDRALREAAAAGRLDTREEIAAQAARMVEDPRARAKLRQFFRGWLHMEHDPDLAKETERFPGFDAALAGDLRTSIELLIDEVIEGEGGGFQRLILGEEIWLNDRMARYYGYEPPAGPGFRKVAAKHPGRVGILTHPYLAARFAYTDVTSPIHRGVFLARGVLGRALRPPPVAVAPLASDLHPDLTTRERVAEQTRPEACHACHRMINPLGYALERFDADGRYRETERERPIDATGWYEPPEGEKVTFDGARELARYLASSQEVHEAFVRQLFHYLAKQPLPAYGKGRLTELRNAFVEGGFDVRRLAAEIAATCASHGRPIE